MDTKFTIFKTIATLTLLSACGGNSVSKQNAIIGETQDWLKMPESLEHQILSIHLNDTFLGTGFIFSTGRLITNAHVANAIKYCALLQLGCGEVVAKSLSQEIVLTDVPSQIIKLIFILIMRYMKSMLTCHR